MTTSDAQGRCLEVDENMADVVEGVAADALLDHMAGCERCRDARYDAEQAILRIGDAALDYRVPDDLAARLASAIDARPAGAGSLLPVRVSQTLASVRGLLARRPTGSARPSSLGRDASLPSARWAWLSLAAALGLGLLWLGTRRTPSAPPPSAPVELTDAWQGQVLQVERAFGSPSGLRQCARSTQVCQPLAPGEAAHPGMRLETDGLTRARLKLSDGSLLALDRKTRLELDPTEHRRARLLEGNIVAEIEPLPDAEPGAGQVVLDLPAGRVEVLGTKLSLRVDEDGDGARVEVSRGSVKLYDARDQSLWVQAGEAGVIGADRAPRVERVLDLAQALGWSSDAFEPASDLERQGALGELIAKRPRDGQELSGAVRLTQHHIKARIVDNIARTEVEEVFENQTNEVLEGIYRFPLPPGAQIERLALEVDGKLEEGAFVDRERAAAIWRGAVVNAGGKRPAPSEDIVWVPGPWRDPALLEWQRGSRFELRIFPIPARSSRRVVLAYTEVLPPSAGERTYVYPLPHDPRGSTKIARFTAEVQVRGHDVERGVEARGYPLKTLSGSAEVVRLAHDANDFVPSGDLSVTFELERAEAELRTWAYQPDRPVPGGPARALGDGADGDAAFVAMALRPVLPRRARHEPRDYVIVTDTSRSMIGENYRRAVEVVTRVIREMDRNDRVRVLGCDASCRAAPGGYQTPGDAAAAAARRFLAGIEPEGASDLAFAVEQAAALRDLGAPAGAPDSTRSLRVIYVGDGTPTVGPLHPALLARAIAAALPRGASLNAIAIGSDADRGALRTATRAGGGVDVAFTPGRSVEDVALAVLGASYGHSLQNARLALPEGLTRVTPTTLGSIAAGAEELLVMRMTAPRVQGEVVLSGDVAGEAFERRYPVDIVASAGASNAFVPRLYAAVAIAELEGSMDEHARRRSIELSTRFNVASRYTSLLVLESPAMFSAFGLDNRRSAPEWTGELESQKQESSGDEIAFMPAEDDGTSEGRGASVGSAPSAAKQRSAPSQEAPPSQVLEPFELPQRRMIPMRRVWQRVARIDAPPGALRATSAERRKSIERRLRDNAESRQALHSLYVVDFLAGDLDAAARSAERWSDKDPLDVGALTARADLAAQRGQRELAIRILGSVIDVRPGDYKAQWRLARLHRWAGRPERGCRHSLAVAQLMLRDAKLVSEAVGCSRDIGHSDTAEALLAALEPGVRTEVERLVQRRRASDELSGDFRVLASWQGSEHDVDLVIVHPDGYRVSWLGAPTRAVISANDVLSVQREGLGLRGAKPGQYAIELVRSSASPGSIRGSVQLQVADAQRSVPFVLEGQRARVATITLRSEERLVPLDAWEQ